MRALAVLLALAMSGCGSCGPDQIVITDCHRTKACSVSGQCELRAGQCVATNEGCRVARVCSQHGRCLAHASGECEAVSEDDCKASETCRREGRCKLGKGNVDVPRACVGVD
jgi:hypothetical protein